MLPLVVVSLMAIGLYFSVRNIDFSELGKTALFYVVMVCVTLGIAGLFGVVGAWLRSSVDDDNEGFCFVGALIGTVVFYVATQHLNAPTAAAPARQTIRAASSNEKNAGCAQTVSTDRRSRD